MCIRDRRERVDRGEQRYIMPFKPRAHGSIDSFYSAELGVYRPLLRDELERLALPELSDVVEVMRELPDVPADLVPDVYKRQRHGRAQCGSR